MISRRRFIERAMAVAAGALLSACSTPTVPKAEETNWLTAEDISNMPKTTIRYWFYESPERITLGEKQVQEFQAKFKNIEVVGRQAPPAVDNNALLAYIKAGTNSHVHHSYYQEDLWYIDHNVPYSPEGLPGFEKVIASLNPNANYKYKDKVWSLPWYLGGQAIAYNKKMVNAAGLDPNSPPNTYSQFYEWAKALTIPGKQWFMAPSTGEDWWIWLFVLQPFYIAATGTGDLVKPDGKTPIFNNDGYAAALQLFYDLFKNKYATSENFSTDPFLGGQVAATIGGVDMHKGIQRDGPKDFEYIVGPIPKPDGSSVQGNKTFLFVRNLMLIKEIQKKGEEADRIMRAAWEFEKFLLSPEQMAADFAVSGEPPAAVDVTTNPLYVSISGALGPQFQWHVKYIAEQGVKADMNSGRSVDIDDIQQKMYLNIIRNKMQPAEALKWAEEETIKLLAD